MGAVSILKIRFQGDLRNHSSVIMTTLGKLAEAVIKDASTEHGNLPELRETAKGNPALQILAEKGDCVI